MGWGGGGVNTFGRCAALCCSQTVTEHPNVTNFNSRSSVIPANEMNDWFIDPMEQ